VLSNSTFPCNCKEEKAIDFSGESVYYLQQKIVLMLIIHNAKAFVAAEDGEYFLYINEGTGIP
jgi:hypothetical protein